MKKLNPIYLWYSIILLFPPVHEWGHVFIAGLIGETVVKMDMFSVSMINISQYHFLHDMWDFSPLIAGCCCLLSSYLIARDISFNNIFNEKVLKHEANKIKN
jgi:phosphate/sulfate permease